MEDFEDSVRFSLLLIRFFDSVTRVIVAMGKKKQEESGATAKVKGSSKEVEKEKLSVSAMLASMDQKPDKTKKGVSSFSSTSAKPKAKCPKIKSYTDGIDLPPSDEEEDEYASEEEQIQSKRRQRQGLWPLDISISEKELKKLVIGSRASVLDGEDEADANVKDITIDNFSVSARGKELLKNVSLKISHGKRYGLVGPNGMGKSTLLKLLAWRKIPVPKNIDVLLVEQEVVGDDRIALQAVVSANEELLRLREEVAVLQNSSSAHEGEDDNDVNGNDAGERLAELYEKLQILGSDAAEAQASKILAGLGFTKEMQGRPTQSFSGGWRTRISLAGALFVQPTLLLLDEPTNHLELTAVLWLEEYLYRWKKTLVVVSHDCNFLNTVCTEIIHLHDLKLQFYCGNFDILNQEKEAAKNKGKGKIDEDEPAAEAPKKWRDYSVEFHFPEPTELTPPLLQIINVSFSYPNREDFRLSDVDLGIDMGTRVAIAGPNGAGKSTLLNLIAGDLVSTEGEV
ncbi:hypothetical protein CRYUN_Cryun02cG0146500 [Craigia yunnanensis]